MRALLIGALSAACIGVAPARAVSQLPVGLPVGSRPAPIAVETLDGEDLDLAAYIGQRPVLFEFWATWCENCAALLPQMEQVQARYGDRIDIVAIAVGVGQTPRSIRRHLDRHPVSYTFLWDRRGRAVREFAAPTTSYVVVLDAAGTVTYTGVGSDQDIEAAVLTALD